MMRGRFCVSCRGNDDVGGCSECCDVYCCGIVVDGVLYRERRELGKREGCWVFMKEVCGFAQLRVCDHKNE